MGTVYFDCAGLLLPTASSVDQIARLKLAAKRNGCDLELENANPELIELLCLAGLAGVLGLELEGEAEQREQLGGVEEEGQLDDPPSL